MVLIGDFNQMRDAMLLSYPLKQVVRSSTRGSAVLDKIYINISDLFERPVILPNIGRSDHHTVVMVHMHKTPQCGEDMTLVVRSQDPNGRALPAQAISNMDWTPLYL